MNIKKTSQLKEEILYTYSRHTASVWEGGLGQALSVTGNKTKKRYIIHYMDCHSRNKYGACNSTGVHLDVQCKYLIDCLFQRWLAVSYYH